MTNAPEGRTYIIKSILDDREIETPFVVPNGKWVLDGCWHNVVGDQEREIQNVKLDTRRHGSENWITISDKPFGVVTKMLYDTTAPWHVVRQRLQVARQIHHGELGKSVRIPSVDYVRQPFGPHQKLSVTKAHQRRRGLGWVKLADLGEVTVGYNPDKWIELVLGYFQFSGHLHYVDGSAVGTLVDTVWGSSLDIKAGEVEVASMTPEQFRYHADLDTSELWIRRGFAFTILRLQALGVAPSVVQTA